MQIYSFIHTYVDIYIHTAALSYEKLKKMQIRQPHSKQLLISRVDTFYLTRWKVIEIKTYFREDAATSTFIRVIVWPSSVYSFVFPQCRVRTGGLVQDRQQHQISPGPFNSTQAITPPHTHTPPLDVFVASTTRGDPRRPGQNTR